MSVLSQKKTNKTLRFHPITQQPISMRIGVMIASAVLLSALLPFSASALDVTDNFSVDATVTGVFQHGEFSGARIDDASRGVVVTDIGINFRPTDRDEFEVVVSIASGDALNTLSPFAVHPLYADDLTDALEDINGRGRDYLLRAWYKHTFALSQDTSLGLSGGIIEATDYLDDNAFANDEVSQFMNDAFVNNTLLVPPSFDVGVGGDLDIGERWSLRGVWMSMKDPDRVDNPDKTYDYFGGQIGFHPQLAWGEGNYRLMAHGASDDFTDPTGAHSERLFGLGLSLDQQLGDDFGAFARFGWQEDDAAIDHDTLYSGGVYVSGKRWGRASDEAGLGYAHLSGGNGDIQGTDIVEGYIKFGFSEYADLSLDIQYLDERTKGENDPRGFVYGMRVNAYF